MLNESPSQDSERGVGRPSKELTLVYLTDLTELVKLINRTLPLSDEAFREVLYDSGGRVAEGLLRAVAFGAIVPGLDLRALLAFLARTDQWRAETARRRAPSSAATSASSFEQAEREASTP